MDFYNQARSAALKELAIAAKQRDVLEQRIARLRQTIASLDVLIEGDLEHSEVTQELQVVGITDAVRNALKIANGARTAIEVRDWLASSGYDLSDQENPLASIHTILKRLVKAGEAQPATNADGKANYRWIGDGANALRSAYFDANVAAWSAIQDSIKGLTASEAVARAAESIAAVAQAQLRKPPTRQVQRLTKNVSTVPEEPRTVKKVPEEPK
jgi:hypothetical protein